MQHLGSVLPDHVEVAGAGAEAVDHHHRGDGHLHPLAEGDADEALQADLAVVGAGVDDGEAVGAGGGAGDEQEQRGVERAADGEGEGEGEDADAERGVAQVEVGRAAPGPLQRPVLRVRVAPVPLLAWGRWQVVDLLEVVAIVVILRHRGVAGAGAALAPQQAVSDGAEAHGRPLPPAPQPSISAAAD